ncbi:MAG: polysaccharide deacetylase family protein [Phycisphaerae bacterium]
MASIVGAGSTTQPAQPAAVAVEICPFKDDKDAALSFTFDDGIRDQVDLAVPLLERYGFRATFFVIAGLTPDHKKDPRAQRSGEWASVAWEEWAELAKRGHEIGSHSLSHPMLDRVTEDKKLTREIVQSKKLIQTKLGLTPISFCYPYNQRTDHVRDLVLKQYPLVREEELVYGRTDFTADTANSWVNQAIQQHRWMVPMIHGIEKGFTAFSSVKVLEAHLKYLKQREPQIWVDTFGTIGRYVKLRDATTLKILQTGAKKVVFQLTSNLDPTIYNLPLTVAIEVHTKKAVASRDAKKEPLPMPIQIQDQQLLLDVTPGPNPITVTWE